MMEATMEKPIPPKRMTGWRWCASLVAVLAACNGEGSDRGMANAPAPAAPPAPGGSATPLAGLIEADVTTFTVGPATVTGYRLAAVRAGVGCDVRMLDRCVVTSCDAVAEPTHHFGTITMRGSGAAVELAPGPSGRYQAATGRVAIWNTGDTLQLAATGSVGTSGALAATLTAPGTVSVTALDGQQWPLAVSNISRSAGLKVAWKEVRAADTVAVLIAGRADGRHTELACSYDAKAGSVDVPARALALLPEGDGTIVVAAGSTTSLKVAGAPLVVLITSTATLDGSHGGRVAAATAHFQ
jgi:hypothetical protein